MANVYRLLRKIPSEKSPTFITGKDFIAKFPGFNTNENVSIS